MKKVIGNKLYDTEKAEVLHSWSYSYPDDFKFRLKVLYRTAKGNYFIYHDGGPMTDMAISVDNNTTSGSRKIEEIDEDEAFEFLKEHDGDELLIELFPEKLEEA